jgi:hypothetical protein
MGFYSVIKKNEIMLFVGKMDGIGDHHVKGNKPDSERQLSNVFARLI